MTDRREPLSAAGFHGGELAVQRRAGVAVEAARLAGMLAPAQLRGGVVRFLAERTFGALTARDASGRLWISPLAGPAGFLAAASPTRLAVHAVPAPGDPLHRLPAGQPVGLLVIEFATRRRVRINGTLAATEGGALHIDVEQAFGNCPQYIQQRDVEPVLTVTDEAETPRHAKILTRDDVELVTRVDTFLIGTTHPTRGSDASHRGGPAGFVRVQDGRLWWPDYPGNNMFNTLGNLQVDPAAALLFADFVTGQTLQLSGQAAVNWITSGAAGDDGGTGRRVQFVPEALVAGRLLPVRATAVTASPYNRALTDQMPTLRRPD
jgi:predicted pyridoxine 5'-phosphate oxidase superfamily flavin-nucleotide-binding protein